MLDKLKFGTYLFFAAFCLLMFLWVFFFVPETRYKSLEEMDLVFGDNSGIIDRERMREIMAEVGLEETPEQTRGFGEDAKEQDIDHVDNTTPV
jgi:hypothetical protein